MPKAWVKNVYKRRITTQQSCGSLYTSIQKIFMSLSQVVNNNFIIPVVIPKELTQLFTSTFAHLYPLYTQLFTLSTYPTIKRTKEI